MFDIVNLVTHRKKILFIVIVSFSWLMITLFYLFIINKSLYINSLGEQYSADYIQKLLDSDKKIYWFTYFSTPAAILIRAYVVALILYLGLFYKQNTLKIEQLFGITLLADAVFMIPGYIKFFWFLCSPNNYDVKSLQTFQPLSLLNLFDVNHIENWLIYPLQTINIFEFGYLFILAYGIHKCLKTTFDKSLKIVVSTYVPALMLWFVFMMFLSVTLSPLQ